MNADQSLFVVDLNERRGDRANLVWSIPCRCHINIASNDKYIYIRHKEHSGYSNTFYNYGFYIMIFIFHEWRILFALSHCTFSDEVSPIAELRHQTAHQQFHLTTPGPQIMWHTLYQLLFCCCVENQRTEKCVQRMPSSTEAFAKSAMQLHCVYKYLTADNKEMLRESTYPY